MNEAVHRRRSIRVPAHDYAAPGAYFVTIVAHDRACLFARIDGEQMQLSPHGRIADECWRCIPDHFPIAELSTYVVMPNHMHGIIVWHEAKPTVGAQHAAPLQRHVKPGSLGAIIRSYKSAVTREIGIQLASPSRIWQRNYYEHIIRNDDDLNRVHLYIESNILNWARDDENPLKELAPT